MTGKVLFVSEHELERAENLRAVWEAYDGPKEFKRGIRNMKHAPQDGFAAVVCDSLPVYMPEKGDCKSIIIGHGITGDKKYALDEKRPGIDRRTFPQIDATVNPSTKTVGIMARQFGISEDRVIPLGMPRTDQYIGKSKGDGGTFLAGKRAYLYAPTFRGPHDGRSLPAIDWELIDSMLGDDEVIAVKRHYFQRDPIINVHVDHIVEVAPTKASARYLIDCDVLLTDYSSIVFDAYVAGKPSVLTVDDMDDYLSTRGLYLDYPRQYSSKWLRAEGNEEGLLETLRRAADDGMTETELDTLELVADMCDGRSTERVCALVKALIGTNPCETGEFAPPDAAASKSAVAKSTGAGTTLLARARCCTDGGGKMAKNEKTKAELAAEAAEMGVEVPAKATKAQIQALIDAKKADSGASEAGNGEKAPDSGSEKAVMRVACPGFSGLNVRMAPHGGAPVVKVLENGAEVAVESVDGPWAKVNGGYCKVMYLA